jgi:G3E family GTPase
VKLLCIAGFLGSGKTTVLLELARTMTQTGLQLAIVENEIGDVGVDGGYVREAGLPVQELFGGCICCTLQTGLVETLRALEAQYAPDWVVVEPTGLAAPGDLMKTVRTYMPQIARSRVLTLVDAGRWEMLQQVVEPLITAQLEAADVIAVNKIDQVDEAVVARIEEVVRRANATAAIRRVSAVSGSGLGDLQGCLL